MPIVKCHECGKDVSTGAKTCPSCGVKVKKPTSRAVKLIGLAFTVAVIGTAITGNNNQPQQNAESSRRASLTPEQRAKNSFGAILPSSAVLTTKGKMLLREHDGNSFVSAWNKACVPPGGDDIATIVTRTILK